MFKKIFISLCNEQRESPSAVCKKVGITPATFSGWNDNTIPRQATLMRIADYFGVTVEYLLGSEEEQPKEIMSFEKQQLHKKIDSVSDEEAKLFLSMFDLILKSKDNNENN